MDDFADKPLRYLIGAGDQAGSEDVVTEVGYDSPKPKRGVSIAYCNLFYEKYGDDETTDAMRARYGPYLHTSDVASEYHEGQIDPRGPGWARNLDEQFARRRDQGFQHVELDNPDAYHVADVIGAVARAKTFGLFVVTKNPLLVESSVRYVTHPNVWGAIVEEGSGTCDGMEALRRAAGKSSMPVWYVSFSAKSKNGLPWAKARARAIAQMNYAGMMVTHSPGGEYTSAVDVSWSR